MEVRPDIRFYSESALRHPDIFEQAKQQTEFACSMMTYNLTPHLNELPNAKPYVNHAIGEIIDKYFEYNDDLIKNWDIYTAVEYDLYERPDEVIFVGEQWETELASKYFGDGMLETVE